MQEEQKPDEERYKKECNNGAVKFLSFFVQNNYAVVKQALTGTQVKPHSYSHIIMHKKMFIPLKAVIVLNILSYK